MTIIFKTKQRNQKSKNTNIKLTGLWFINYTVWPTRK